jgi:hypothetical protein
LEAVKILEGEAEKDLQALKSRYRIVVGGVAAIQMGRPPEECSAIARRAATASPEEHWELADFVEQSAAMHRVYSEIRDL